MVRTDTPFSAARLDAVLRPAAPPGEDGHGKPPVPRTSGRRAAGPAPPPTEAAEPEGPPTEPLEVLAPDPVPSGRLRRLVPAGWREARLDPGRPGALVLALVAAIAAVVAAVGVWLDRPRAEPVTGLPAVVVDQPA